MTEEGGTDGNFKISCGVRTKLYLQDKDLLAIHFKEIKRDSIAKDILKGRDLCIVAEILFNTVFEGSIVWWEIYNYEGFGLCLRCLKYKYM